MNKPKILIWDIETLPNKGYFFGLYEQAINPNFIIKEKSIISIAYKWLDEKQTHVISIADNKKLFKKDPYDDYYVISEFGKVLKEADYIVAHYGDKFDTLFLQSRVFLNKQIELPKVPTIDTYKLVKKYFKLNSNKLDYIGKSLGFGGKMPMDWSMWVRCAEGDIKAVKRMAEYNKRDVQLLEKVFKHILKYTDTKINYQLFEESGEIGLICTNCGSLHLNKRGTFRTIKTIYQRYQCTECGHWLKEKK